MLVSGQLWPLWAEESAPRGKAERAAEVAGGWSVIPTGLEPGLLLFSSVSRTTKKSSSAGCFTLPEVAVADLAEISGG